ncbi:unnamed protein product [Pieris macdunnoughi]|uniref:Uncharacterized protein n=1 Tax=Pieris macdunnoughi TaxID=345717 RepID=A0A821RHU8_9NEOP|nr:unnamed protein product [Pieris macdunnoughi]
MDLTLTLMDTCTNRAPSVTKSQCSARGVHVRASCNMAAPARAIDRAPARRLATDARALRAQSLLLTPRSPPHARPEQTASPGLPPRYIQT